MCTQYISIHIDVISNRIFTSSVDQTTHLKNTCLLNAPGSAMRLALCSLCLVFAAFPRAETFSRAWINQRCCTGRPRIPSQEASYTEVALRGHRRRSRGRSTTTALAAEKQAIDVGDVKRGLSSARERLEKNKRLLDVSRLRGELEHLEGISSQEGFWDDAATARKTLSDLNRYFCCEYLGAAHRFTR